MPRKIDDRSAGPSPKRPRAGSRGGAIVVLVMEDALGGAVEVVELVGP
jgi:hypothetical protein